MFVGSVGNFLNKNVHSKGSLTKMKAVIRAIGDEIQCNATQLANELKIKRTFDSDRLK
jgi:Zn-dependent M32 family carboxypeptidase